MAVTADGMFSVSYTGTRIGNLATGFHMVINGPKGSLGNRKEVNISIDGVSAKLGSSKAVVKEIGKSYNRTFEGDSSVVVDPIFSLFERLVIIQTQARAFQSTSLGSGTHGKVVVITAQDMMTLYKDKLAKGDIEGFIQGLIGDDSGIVINYDSVGESPIIKALKLNSSTAIFRKSSMNAARSLFQKTNILSVGDIFQQFISPLGLELYWMRDNVYNLEPPRILSDPKPVATIKKTEIIELNSVADPYNVPDIVIPRMHFQNALGTSASNTIVIQSLIAGVINSQAPGRSGVGGQNLKVSTYDVPPFLYDAHAMGQRQSLNAKNKELGTTLETNPEFEASLAGFYSSHARKSELYKLNTGRCVTILNPKLNQPYAWYNIDGEDCFVSNIRHEISRTRAVTILEIAGKNTGHLTDPSGGSVQYSPAEDAEVNDLGRKGEDILKSAAGRKERADPKWKKPEGLKDAIKDGKTQLKTQFGDADADKAKIDSVNTMMSE